MSHPDPPHATQVCAGTPLTRRQLLLGMGTIGLAGMIGCGSDTTTTAANNGGDPGPPAPGPGDTVLVASFDASTLPVVGENRLPLILGGGDGVPLVDGPAELTLTVVGPGGLVGDPLTVARHADGVPIGYYPLKVTLPDPGTYTIRAEIDGNRTEQAIQVNATSPTGLVQPGQALIDVATPTTTDPLGTDPLCTRRPEPCPLHDVGLPEAIARGTPVAIMFSTPQFCSTGVCGPTLDLLLEQVDRHRAIQFIHCEIYRSPPSQRISLVDAVEAFGLTYEPSLFVADGDGQVVTRLDNIFDRREIAHALETVST